MSTDCVMAACAMFHLSPEKSSVLRHEDHAFQKHLLEDCGEKDSKWCNSTAMTVGNSSWRLTIATSYVPHFCTALPYSSTQLYYYFVRIYEQFDSYVEHRFGPMKRRWGRPCPTPRTDAPLLWTIVRMGGGSRNSYVNPRLVDDH
ncbi:unnamed protein product [Hydatigera taeniaeformis]|uniref:Uncharacterized protein n=1 Tax=Hydatigena taeniaeformis TaxID=6205 RepID=A0A0R3XC81_HYDTA|nr:unnamed protein product [Hydatigera taeniaeformis]